MGFTGIVFDSVSTFFFSEVDVFFVVLHAKENRTMGAIKNILFFI